MVPGEYILKEDEIVCNARFESITLKVTNTGDRPVQVGSHYHFFEINKEISLDREKAFGKRLDILAGTAMSFEPGESTEVKLIDYSGARKAYGGSDLTQGDTTSKESLDKAMKRMESENFKNIKS